MMETNKLRLGSTPFRFLLLAFALLATWVLATPRVLAQGNGVPLIVFNQTNLTICDLYISPSSSSTWNNEVLGNSTMGPWAQRTFYVAVGIYDLRANYCNGEVVERFDVSISGGGHRWTITGTGGYTPQPAPPGGGSGDCVIPPSGPWPPCARGGGTTPAPNPNPGGGGACVIPPSGPWPPCARGGGAQPGGNQNAGNVALGRGFTPNPWQRGFNVTPGRNASELGRSCLGRIEWNPTLRLAWSGAGSALTISTTSSTDTVLVVRDPSGRIWCDDDSGDLLNPVITLGNTAAGNYEIYVGTYNAANAAGTLLIRESTQSANPNNAVQLRAGFTPDPWQRGFWVQANRPATQLGSDCRGSIDWSPTAVLNWSGRSSHLRFYVTSTTDTVLVVRTPDGRIYCNDDWETTLHPMVMLNNPLEGRYEIYVGVYSANNAGGTLYISELTNRNPNSPN